MIMTVMRELTQVLALTGVWMIGGFSIMLVTAIWKIYRNVPAEEAAEFATYWRGNMVVPGNGSIWKKIDRGITNLMLWPRTIHLVLSSIDEALVDWNQK